MSVEKLLKKIKEILTSEILLTHYNPKLKIVVASGISVYGIGTAVLCKFKDINMTVAAHLPKKTKKNSFTGWEKLQSDTKKCICSEESFQNISQTEF